MLGRDGLSNGFIHPPRIDRAGIEHIRGDQLGAELARGRDDDSL